MLPIFTPSNLSSEFPFLCFAFPSPLYLFLELFLIFLIYFVFLHLGLQRIDVLVFTTSPCSYATTVLNPLGTTFSSHFRQVMLKHHCHFLQWQPHSYNGSHKRTKRSAAWHHLEPSVFLEGWLETWRIKGFAWLLGSMWASLVGIVSHWASQIFAHINLSPTFQSTRFHRLR